MTVVTKNPGLILARPEADPLAESIDRLTAELQLLRQVIDELREDFSWVTRNGLPIQPVEHCVVKQMALDPCAKDWGERLIIERHTSSPGSPLVSGVLDHFAADLKTTFEAIAQGQLEIVLTALDGVRGQLLSSLKRPHQTAETSNAEASETPAPAPTPVPSREKPPRGHLF